MLILFDGIIREYYTRTVALCVSHIQVTFLVHLLISVPVLICVIHHQSFKKMLLMYLPNAIWNVDWWIHNVKRVFMRPAVIREPDRSTTAIRLKQERPLCSTRIGRDFKFRFSCLLGCACEKFRYRVSNISAVKDSEI